MGCGTFMPNWAVNLRTWGEAGVVAEGQNGKSGDCGIKMMFIGYPANRESDSVWMWDPSTNGVVTTCDIIWMKRMYYTHPAGAVINVDLHHLMRMQKMLRMPLKQVMDHMLKRLVKTMAACKHHLKFGGLNL